MAPHSTETAAVRAVARRLRSLGGVTGLRTRTKQQPKRFNALVAGLGAMALAACGSEASPDEVEPRLEATLPALIDEVANGTGFLEESQTMDALFASLDSMDGAFSDLPFTGSDEIEPLPAADGDGDAPSGDEIASALADQVFNEDNYEGDGVYGIPAELLCPTDPDTGSLAPDCVAMVDDAELRIRVELAGDGLDFTLLVGPDRNAPVVLELRSDRASVAVDLDEAAAAAEHLSSVTGEDIELPDTLEGTVAVTLTVHAPKDVSLAVAIREDVVIEGSFPEVGNLSFSSAAADPLAMVRIDGSAERLTALCDLGPTSLSMPWQSFDPSSLATGDFHLDWQGASARITLEEGDQSITIEDIGFGDGTSTVSLDEFTLFALDLNASAGRRMAVTISPTDALPSFTVAPEMDLSMTFDLGPLAGAGDDVPDYLIDQSYSVRMDGSMPTAQPVESADGTEGALSIVSGTLTIDSSEADAIVVDAGSCLVADPLESGEHPVLGYLAAGSCP